MISTSKPKSHIHPWCIVRQLPNMQRLVVARFHRRGDEEAEELRIALLEAILTSEAIPTQQDQHGQRYVVDFLMVRLDKQALVRSV